MGRFTAQIVDTLRERLFQLQTQARGNLTPEEKDLLLEVRIFLGSFHTN